MQLSHLEMSWQQVRINVSSAGEIRLILGHEGMRSSEAESSYKPLMIILSVLAMITALQTTVIFLVVLVVVCKYNKRKTTPKHPDITKSVEMEDRSMKLWILEKEVYLRNDPCAKTDIKCRINLSQCSLVIVASYKCRAVHLLDGCACPCVCHSELVNWSGWSS